MNKLPQTLDAEFRRLARVEGRPMEELVVEIAGLVGKSPRQIYNFRSGKWPLPTDILPALCRRFGSRSLIHALEDECCVEVAVPDAFDLSRLIAQTIREDLRHYERVMDAFEDSTITANEYGELVASGTRVVANVRQFEAIAQSALDRRLQTQPQPSANSAK